MSKTTINYFIQTWQYVKGNKAIQKILGGFYVALGLGMLAILIAFGTRVKAISNAPGRLDSVVVELSIQSKLQEEKKAILTVVQSDILLIKEKQEQSKTTIEDFKKHIDQRFDDLIMLIKMDNKISSRKDYSPYTADNK